MNLFAAADAMQATDDEIRSLMRGNIGDEDVSPMLRGGMFSFVTPKGREYSLAKYADKLFPPPPPPPPYNEELDAVHPIIEDSGLPGTQARIDAYREWYATRGETSPNEGLLDLDTEVDYFIINVLSTKGVSTMRDTLFALATECHREALNS